MGFVIDYYFPLYLVKRLVKRPCNRGGLADVFSGLGQKSFPGPIIWI